MKISTLGNAVSMGRFPLGCAYVIQQQYRNEYTTWGKIGNLMLLPADAGGSILFFQEIAGHVPKLLLARTVSILYMAAYLPIAIDAVIILAAPRAPALLKRQALFDLATAVTQIALAVFFLMSYSSVPLAIAAGGIACTAFLHRKFIVNRTNNEYQPRLS